MGFAAACRKPSPAPPAPERTRLTAHDPGYQVLAEVANARWAIAHGARIFAQNELARAIRDASTLPDKTTSIFAASPVAGGGQRGQSAGPSQMTIFEAMVTLQSAKEDVDGGDLAGADKDLAPFAAAVPSSPTSSALPLLQASEALSIAQGDAENRISADLGHELQCAEEALAAYRGPARQADARALAHEIGARGAGVDPVQLEVWSTRIAGWV